MLESGLLEIMVGPIALEYNSVPALAALIIFWELGPFLYANAEESSEVDIGKTFSGFPADLTPALDY